MAWGPLMAGLALVGASVSPADRSQDTPHDRPTLSAAELFDLANRAANAGDFLLSEKALRALADNPERSIRHEALFRLAMIRRARGNDRDAAVLLRRILDAEPGAARVRLELAATLQKLGDRDATLRQLRALRSAPLPPSLARFVDRAAASLQASKPVGVQFEIAMAPDSNVNRGTRSDTLGTVLGDFDIGRSSRRRSGIGIAMRGVVNGRLAVADTITLTGRVGGDATLFRRKEYDDMAAEIAAGPEFRLGKNRIAVEASAALQWFGLKPFQRSLRIAAGLTRSVGPATQVRFDGASRWVDNRFNDLQDGRGVGALARIEHAISPTTLLSTSIGVDRFRAKDDAYSTTSWNGGVAIIRDMGRMTVTAGIDAGRLTADDRLLLLPRARKDRSFRLHVGAVFRQATVAGFAPIARISLERNASNVEYYDYRRVRTEFGISRAF